MKESKNGTTESIKVTQKDKNLKPFECIYANCSATFSKRQRLLAHTGRHTGKLTFLCDEPNCTKAYELAHHLKRHKKTFHLKEKQFTVCNYKRCEKVIQLSNLKKHCSRKHGTHQELKYSCTECGLCFSKEVQLKKHTYSHTGEAPFRCGKCSYGFTNLIDFNKHLKRSHKTYSCELCKQVFEKYNLLRTHKLSCKLEHKCEVCEKTFSSSTNLKQHMKTHMDLEKKLIYTCPYQDCPRFYFQNKNLTYHINSYHEHVNNDLKLSCPYENCKVILKNKQTLKHHIIKMHESSPRISRPRKPRKDKNIPRTSMFATLTGVDRNSLQEEMEESLSENISDTEQTDEQINKSVNMQSEGNHNDNLDDTKNTNENAKITLLDSK